VAIWHRHRDSCGTDSVVGEKVAIDDMNWT
jgi:hypothetical protein